MAADAIRHLFDVFMMPVFFFVAGYFVLPSLNRQEMWGFLKGKFKRIGIPWLLAILIIIPLVKHVSLEKVGSGYSLPSFWQYWVEYLKTFGTFRIGLPTPESMGQMHFWFLSLLLTFFIVFVLFQAVGKRILGPPTAFRTQKPISNKSILKTFFLAAIFSSLDYFTVILMTPDMSWITVDLLFQFQPASLMHILPASD